ncbi:MAG TPA: winged helix DNA-binding protein [Candidatus Binataceae bacterium]|nr:winged helix DNA-binding protein [Candidatus Binataceae bacterium]
MSTMDSNGRTTPAERQAADLLELFYPIHYRGNMAVEDAMRGDLTRKQAAIMWLIRSAGSDRGRSMRRKEIVARLQDWFDITSPAVTQALRQMANAPFGLVRLVEDAQSGREKRVILTAKGERFLAGMVERGRDFLRKLVEQLPENQVSGGVQFLRAAIAAYEHVHAEEFEISRLGNLGNKEKPRTRRTVRTREQERYGETV